jgi:hypothetical protein
VARPVAWLLILTLLSMNLSLGATTADELSTQSIDYTDFSIGGGTATIGTTIVDNAGPRFMQFIEPPVFTRTEEALANPDLVPGDLGDQGGESLPIVTQRRGTSYDYMKEDWTGGILLENIQGSPDAWLCLCDLTINFANENGRPPTLLDRVIEITNSRYLWVDNITSTGPGGILLNGGERFIFSNSHFVDSSFLAPGGTPDSNHGLVHNLSFTNQRGPLDRYHHPPQEIEDLLGTNDPMCWPHDINPCTLIGIEIIGGTDWTIEWSHIHGNGGFFTWPHNTILRHNSLYDSGGLTTSGDDSEISWNLIRGHSSGINLDVRGTSHTEIHNNTIIRPHKIDHREAEISQPGLRTVLCEYCKLRDNDFIGYARATTGGPFIAPPIGEWALDTCGEGTTDASGNYWGTLDDPREPEGVIIRVCDTTTLVLEDWHTEPNHPLPPFLLTADLDDPPYWAERLVRDNTP